MRSLALDLRYALRSLRRRPGPAIAILLSLTVGIGAVTMLFSVVDAVLLRPLPFDDPARLVALYNRYEGGASSLSPPDYMDRRDRSATLSATAAIEPEVAINLTGSGDPQRVMAARVTGGFFDLLGVEPTLGHVAFPHEESGEDDRLAVLSYRFWQRHLGADPEAVGRGLVLDGEAYTVLAVMPPAFDLPRGSELWLPLRFTPEQLADDYRGNEYLQAIGRMKAGASLEQVRAEMETIAASVIERVPERADFLSRNGWGASTEPLVETIVGAVRPALVVLLAAAALMLLMVCVNVANLLLAKTAGRERELAVRASVGASRPRLVAQLLAESALLALLGAAGGLVLAHQGLRALIARVPHDVPRLEQVALDGRAVLTVAAIALLCCAIFGTAPAWQGASAALRGLSHRAMGPAGRRLRRALVVAEVALALLLMIGAGLLLTSYRGLLRTDPGFETAGRLSARVTLPADEFPAPEDRLAFQQRMLAALDQRPEIAAVAVSDRLPLDGQRWTGTFHVEGQPPAPGEQQPGGDFNIVSPRYFETLGIPLLEGRAFAATDTRDAAGVAIVDRRVAERFWPPGEAVGKRIHFAAEPQPEDYYEVVGVAGSVTHETLDEDGRMQVYLSSFQRPIRAMTVTVRAADGPGAGLGTRDPARLVGLVRHEVRALAPALPVYGVRTLGEIFGQATALARFNLAVLGAFAILALALAAIGVYGVLSEAVDRRTAEVGMRMALGASPGAILGALIGEGLALVAAGLALGLLAAWPLTRALESLLYGVAPGDPATFVTVAAALFAVALTAAFLPARRASKLDPIRALRAE